MKQLIKFHKTIRVRMLLTFFTVFTSAMVMPYTIIYFSDSIGPALTTTMIIVIGVISMVGYFVGGRATDYFGRKSIIILSEVVTGIGFIVISYFDYIPIFYAVPILIAFSIVYFFQSAANPAYSALIIDSSEESERRTIYTYFIWFQSVAFALGSVVGGFYFENYSALLYFVMGATSFVSTIFTYFFIKERKLSHTKLNDIGQKDNNKENETINVKAQRFGIAGIFIYRLFLFLCIGTFLLNILSEQIYNYLSIRIVENYRIEDFSITGHQMMGYLHLEDTLIMTVAAGLILKVTKSLTDKTSLIFGLTLNIIGYLFLSYFVHPISLLIGMLFIASGFLIYRPVEQTIIANSIPEHARGKYLSILGLMSAFGGMISGLFIWGSEYISEIGISIIFLGMGIAIIFNYLKAFKYVDAESKEKVDKSEYVQAE